MSRRRHTPEQIITALREAEVGLANGKTVAMVSRELGISEQTYYRWRQEFGGMKVDQARRFKELEKENARLGEPEHVDANTEKKLLNGSHASPEIIVSSATASSARSSITIWRFPFPSAISPGHLYSPAQFSPASGASLKWPSTTLPTKAD